MNATPSSLPEPVFGDAFQREIVDRFGLTEVFVRRLIQGKRLTNRVIEKWEDLVNPNQQLSGAYIHFALSNVVRGRHARDLIMRKTGITGGRSLDVGSAYGGMVVAFAEAGFDAAGVEIDPVWCELGNYNCNSKGFGDLITLRDFLATSGDEHYDVITCNDVIEHVNEPRHAIAKMASALNPGGAMYLVVPNATSYDHVVRDGHYGQFGMNLLEHFAARAYYDSRCKGIYGKSYSCGEFYRLSWYVRQLESNGLQATIHRTTANALPTEARFAEILAALDAARGAWKPDGLPEILSDQIADRFDDYRKRLVAHYGDAKRLPETHKTSFVETYLDSFWTLFGTRAA